MFAPVEAAVGAVLIQAATTTYLSLSGKTVGFSSTLYGVALEPSLYPVSIVGGLALACAFVKTTLPDFIPQYNLQLSSVEYAAAGALVGLGTSWGSGCTSGHMLAGLSRLRYRSLVATAIFFGIAVALVTIFDIAPSCGVERPCWIPTFTVYQRNKSSLVALVVGSWITSYGLLPWLAMRFPRDYRTKVLVGINTGVWFGLGLLISGMATPAKTLGFLAMLRPDKFDPSLAMIPVFTIVPNILLWRRVAPQTQQQLVTVKPVLEPQFSLSFSSATPPKFLLGNAVFGAGWGLLGVCPGPGILALAFNGTSALLWAGAFIAFYQMGQFL